MVWEEPAMQPSTLCSVFRSWRFFRSQEATASGQPSWFTNCVAMIDATQGDIG
jgi:hypothetical protein